MPSTTLKKVQIGQEVAWGTGVAATAWLMGVTDCELEIGDVIYQSDEKGTYAPSILVANTYQDASGTVEQDLTYDDILYPCDNVFDEESPAGADPYTWTWAAPDGTQVSPNIFTIEIGATSAEYECNGCLIDTLTISGDRDGDDIWKASWHFNAEIAVAAAMTSLSRRTVELIRMADTLLYVDGWAGTMGSTAVGSTLIAFELSIETGRHNKAFTGSVNPLTWGDNKYTGTLSTTLEYNASTKAYIDALIAPALVQRQIEIEATSGADSATIQFCGTLQPGTLWEDREGNMTVTLNWLGTYNSTFGNWLTIIVINSIASLT